MIKFSCWIRCLRHLSIIESQRFCPSPRVTICWKATGLKTTSRARKKRNISRDGSSDRSGHGVHHDARHVRSVRLLRSVLLLRNDLRLHSHAPRDPRCWHGQLLRQPRPADSTVRRRSGNPGRRQSPGRGSR